MVDPEFTFSFGQEEEGSGSGKDEKDNPIDQKDLKSLLAYERKLRLDAEEKNRELEREVMDTKKQAAKLQRIINSRRRKQSKAPPAKIATKPQTNEVPILPAAVGTAITANEPTQEDGSAAILDQIPGKSKQVTEPEVITIFDTPPVSPQPIPIDSEGNKTEDISVVPNSSSSSAVGKFPRSHERVGKCKTLGVIVCKCGKGYGTAYNLQQHIYYYRNRQRFGCPYCMRRFPYNCYLQKHLENIHNIEKRANGVVRSTRRVQSQRLSVKCAEKIKPRKKKVKRRNSTKKRITARKASGSGMVNLMNTKCSPHRQVSRSSSENYACACKRSYARKSELQAHIEEMKKKVAD